MLDKEISWFCNIKPDMQFRADGFDKVAGPYVFGGTAVVNADLEVGKNGWGIPDEELNSFSKQFHNAQLRKDHGKSVDSVVGKVIKGSYSDGAVKFVAEIGDKTLAEKIQSGYIDHVSISASAGQVVCNVCGKETRPSRSCACEGSHELIRNIKLKELSLVAEPAFDSAKIVPLSFSAAINESFAEKIPSDVSNLSQENKETKTETKTEAPIKAEVVAAVKPAGSEDSKVIIDKAEAVVKKMDEAITKYQMFWDEAPKREQMFWEKSKKEAAECKSEEAPKKDEEAPKKEESAPGATPITPIATPSVILNPPPVVKKFDAPPKDGDDDDDDDAKKDEDEDECKEEQMKPPALQAKTDISQDTTKAVVAAVPTDPQELLAAALGDIKKAAIKAEIM